MTFRAEDQVSLQITVNLHVAKPTVRYLAKLMTFRAEDQASLQMTVNLNTAQHTLQN
jgi:hypothetical protein